MAQGGNGTVEGRVVSKGGKPVSEATIFIKIRSMRTHTSPEGLFSLSVPSGEHALIVKSIGLEESTVKIFVKAGEALKIDDIKLSETPLALNEVVITGNPSRNHCVTQCTRCAPSIANVFGYAARPICRQSSIQSWEYGFQTTSRSVPATFK